jgi:hypothetical protein
MVFREPDQDDMLGYVVQPYRLRALDHYAEHALALGQMADPLHRRGVHAGVDEPDQAALRHDTECHGRRDLECFRPQVRRLLADAVQRDRLGAGAREHIRRNFVGDLRRYAELFPTVTSA